MSVYWRCLVFLLLLAALHHVANAQKDTKILSMPGIAKTKSYVNVSQWRDNLIYTICTWMTVDRNISFFDYPIAYFQSYNLFFPFSVNWDYENNRIIFGGLPNKMFFGYCPPRSWFHLCIVFTPNIPDRLYINGNQVGLLNNSYYNGKLYRDNLEKLFRLEIGGRHGFKGLIYKLNVWNSPLTDQQISDLANCKSKAEGNQLSWTYVTQNIELDKPKFITGTGPCTTPITRQKMELLSVDEEYNIEPVNCTASSSSLPEPSSAPMTEDSSQPSSGGSSFSNQPGSSQPSFGSSSFPNQPGSSQPSSGSSSFPNQPGSSQPSTGGSSFPNQPGSSQPPSGSSSI